MAENDASPAPSVESVVVPAQLTGARVIVWNPAHGNLLYKESFYGKPVGIRKPKTVEFDRPLELDVIEAYYLLVKGRITITDSKTRALLAPKEFHQRISPDFEHFSEKYLVYEDLRDKGYIVKPGLKFGSDFAVYEQGPGIDHAPFLVHLNPEGTRLTAIEMVRAGRLATSVRKKFVIATIDRAKVPRYFAFNWFKP